MIRKTIRNFDLGQISRSGQCFRMENLSGNTWRLIAFGRYLEVQQQGEQVEFSCSEEEFENIWRNYFDLDTDYEKVKQSIDPEDGYLLKAARLGGGIRILRQELWEMIVTFIISQRNNIPRIKKCVETICREFGEEKRDFRDRTYHVFPTPQALAKAGEERLRECGLGYRAPYIAKTAWLVCTKDVDLCSLEKLEYGKAREELLRLNGVGGKVADCISLFGLHHMEAFPIDTHIQQMLTRYPDGFPFEKYRGFAGVLQQYAFYYELFGEESHKL